MPGGKLDQIRHEIGAYAIRAVDRLHEGEEKVDDMIFWSYGECFRIKIERTEPPKGLPVEGVDFAL